MVRIIVIGNREIAMFHDCRGLEITATSSDAITAFDQTVDSYLGIKPAAGTAFEGDVRGRPRHADGA